MNAALHDRHAHTARPMAASAASAAFSAPSALAAFAALAAAVAVAGCATRSGEVLPLPANPADFALWGCNRIDDEVDLVQQRAADVAYAVDERAGNNILALSVGVTLFWPAILAMRPQGPEAAELARLKGRYEALRVASRGKDCPPALATLAPEKAAAFPLAVGERALYEDRGNPRQPAAEWWLQLTALRRNEIEFQAHGAQGDGPWRQDLAGNVLAAPAGWLSWPRLLRPGLELGQVLAGDIVVTGDGAERARMRGQVVAVGPQVVGGRRFDAAVIELFGDAPRGKSYTPVSGALVVDRVSGLLLRLDLSSSHAAFALQRRLLQVQVQAEPH
jgi:hypothetical protein